jgi:hypothetical protein
MDLEAFGQNDVEIREFIVPGFSVPPLWYLEALG